jgi:predicted phage tail protein
MARLITPSSKREVHLPEGLTIQQAIDLSIEEGLRDHLVVYNFGMEVTDRSFVIRRSDSLVLAVVPQGGGGGGGGKSIIGALLMVALVVTAPYIAGTMMGLTGFAAVAVSTGITMVGGLLISALVKPPTLTPESKASYDQSPTYSLAGQSNGAKPYNPITKIYGRHRYFPNLASSPIISNLGTESRISSIYDFGYGHVQLEDIKIGDTPAGEFEPELYLHTNSLVKNTFYVNRRVGYDQFQYKLTSSNPVQIRSKPKAIEFDVDINFGRGLYKIDDRGNIQSHSVDFNFQYRDTNGVWITLGADSIYGVSAQDMGDGAIRFSASTARPFVAVVSVRTPYPSEFDFRALKLSPDQTDSKYGEESFITMIKSYSEGTVVNLEKPHTMLEMRLLASDKISGTVQNLSAICTSVLRVTDDGVNFRMEATRNPAWIAVDILTGIANPKGLTDDLIDWSSWIELANHCNAMGYHSDFVVDYSTTVLELLNSVLGVARASFTMTLSGKYGCLIDVKKTVPRQLITPSNSRNFHGNRTFTDYAHAFLVSYVDPELNWQKNQRAVYFDGYGENNATIFETLETFGITSADEAWRYGRYMMAQSIHRAETFTVEMDIENLVVQRGDLVHVAHDVPRLGGQACRVVTSSGNEITINQELGIAPTGFTVRLSDGTIKTGRVLGYTQGANGEIVYTLENVGDIEPDDLIVMGIMDRVVNPYLVTEIHPGRDLTAEIALVKYVPEVYTADTGDIPVWNPDYGNDLINTTDLKLVNLKAVDVLIYVSRYPVNEIKITWDVLGFNYDHTDIYVTTPDGKTTLVGDSRSYSFYQLYAVLQNLQWIGKEVVIEAIPISASGLVGISQKTSVMLIKDELPPNKPENFGVNIQSEQVTLFWQISNEPDLLRYEVRFTPELMFPNWANSNLLGFTNWDVNRMTSGARTGTYMLRAYDSSDNASDVALQRTTIESLPNIELITDINDYDSNWAGELSHMERLPVAKDPFIDKWLRLDRVSVMSDVLAGRNYLYSEGEYGNVYPDGVYNFAEPVYFNDVYEVRVSSYIQVHGETPNPVIQPRKDIPLLAYEASTDLWDSWIEYRASDKLDYMADWQTLDSLESLLGSENIFSQWRIISAVGDVTAKVIQFRIRAISKSKNVKVVVTDGLVTVDVADRIWSQNDVIIPEVGRRILFDPPFQFDTTAIAVNIDGNDSPVKAMTSNKDRLGFDLKLVNILDQSPVSGKVDILVRGQGKQRETSI